MKTPCRFAHLSYIENEIYLNRSGDFFQLLEFEGYLDYSYTDIEPDVLFIDISIVEHNKLDDKYFHLLLTAKEVYINTLHTASPVYNFICDQLRIPENWPKRQYTILHQLHNDLHCLDPNIKFLENDFVLNILKAYFRRYPFKTPTTWLRDIGVERDRWYNAWRTANIVRTEERSKIFLAPVRYGIHQGRNLIVDAIKNNPQWLGHYSAMDRINRLDSDQLLQQEEQRYLTGMMHDPTILNSLSYDVFSNSIKGEFEQLHPDDKLIWLSLNPVHVQYYEDTMVSVFGESCENQDIVITEKTYMPLAHGHFILPIASAGNINALCKKGFLFPDFINYSYTNIENHEERVEAFIKEFKRLMEIPIETWRKLYDSNIDIIHHNRQKFFSESIISCGI